MSLARSSVVTQTDRATLVEVIKNLNYAFVRAIQSPRVLVAKFGTAVSLLQALGAVYEKQVIRPSFSCLSTIADLAEERGFAQSCP